MNKITRMTIVLSITWTVIAYPSLYLYEIKSSSQSANVLLIYCKSMQSVYPAETDYMDRCKKERDEIYENEVKNIEAVTAVLTFVPLIIFLILGFLFRIAFKWIKGGD